MKLLLCLCLLLASRASWAATSPAQSIRSQALAAGNKLLEWKAKANFPPSPTGNVRIYSDEGSPFTTPPNAHVGYFASGSALLQLIYDFPDAAHYHLFDIMDYWAYDASPGYLLAELNKAATLMNDNNSLKVLQRGFLDHTPRKVLDPKKWTKEKDQNWFTKNLPGNQALWQPYVFTLQIRLANGSTAEKTVYVHAIDQFDRAEIDYVVGRIPGGLSGLIMDMWPSDPTILGKMSAGLRQTPGSSMKFVAENANGELSIQRWTTSGRDRKSTLEHLKKELGAANAEVFRDQFEEFKTVVLKF